MLEKLLLSMIVEATWYDVEVAMILMLDGYARVAYKVVGGAMAYLTC